jgi:prepilin-type N-terminal cleavage/methylation domain-containing protein
MQNTARNSRLGFTLIELLVVIAIIGILAAMLLPVIRRAQEMGKIKKAQMEVTQIAVAIRTYDTSYNRFPVSKEALVAGTLANGGEDFTYGTSGVACVGPGANTLGVGQGFATPSGTLQPVLASAAANYQANNSEVMAVLLDMEFWPSAPTVPTINQGHVKNPHKTVYLNAARSVNTSAPGIGPDGVYRDPWGQPYIITIDLNGDGKARDAFYREPGVSADPSDPGTPKRGLNGLIPTVAGGKTFYEANSPVTVWSAGPDKAVDPGPGTPANQGANRDNILSWK